MSAQLQRAVTNTIAAGYQLDNDAFKFLEKFAQKEDPIALMEKVVKKMEESSQKSLFIDKLFLEEIMVEATPKPEAERQPSITSVPSLASVELPIESRKEAFQPYAKEVEAQIRVLEDPTAEICTTGSVEEYLEYFQDRFRRLQKFLRQRMDAKDATSVSEALDSPVNSKVKVIGMITDKKESKQRTFLRIEDTQTGANVLVPSNLDNSVLERTKSLLLDQVVCLCLIKGRNNLLILEDVLFPEIPQRTPRKASEPVYAALISDLHAGSKQFMRDEFRRFLLWLNGKFGDPNLREIAGRIKYVVIAGDLADGIGIYPGQVRELAIKDIHRQYSLVSKYLGHIPDYIEVILIPGNHDASRKALPQPALPKEYAEPLFEARKIHSLGNPSSINLHGVEVLVYHGRSLDDVVAAVPKMNYSTPEKAMKLLLQCRHLAPTYGQRTPIAAEKRDFMVIERVPDIFHAGHVHVVKHDSYRGTLIVNSGAWQRQTEYMRKLGVVPDPGIVSVVNLQTLQLTDISFAD